MTESVEELLGQRKGFYKLLAHFKRLLKERYENDLTRLITGEFVRLAPGLGAAAHPLIHVGYGRVINDADIVVEGLAHMHHNHCQFSFERPLPDIGLLGRGQLDILGVLRAAAANNALFEYMESRMQAEQFRALGTGEFGMAMMALMERGSDLVDYVHMLKVPEFPGGVKQLMYWVVDQTFIVYLASKARYEK